MKSISARMMLVNSILLLLLVGISLGSLLVQRKQQGALDALFGTAVEPMRELKVISDRYAVNIVDTTHKVAARTMTPRDGVQSIEASLKEIEEMWRLYTSLKASAKVGDLIGKMALPLAEARSTSLQALDLMKKGDVEGLNQFRSTKLYPGIDPATDIIGQLMDTVLEESKVIGENATALSNMSFFGLVGAVVLALAFSLGSLLYIRKGVLVPLNRSIAAMSRVADAAVGEIPADTSREALLEQITIEGAERVDELGNMARTLHTFRNASLEREALRAQSEHTQADQIRRAKTIETSISEFEKAAGAIVATVASASAELEASARSMMEVAQTASEQSELVTETSARTSDSVRSLARSGDELAAAISEIGEQVEHASSYAAKAATRAQSADTTMMRLGETSRAIAEVVDLIKNIASQTNLLALNATIEAARAGETGKGFAVVAAEVKELATQTTRATDVIAEHVSAIQGASTESAEAMRDIVRMISDIHQVSAAIAVAVTEQGQSTHGIAENVQQVSLGSAETTAAIGVVSEAASNTGAAASQVLSASADLAHQSAMMREKVDSFLRAVREA